MICRTCFFYLSNFLLLFSLVRGVVKSATSDGADCGSILTEPPFTKIEFENHKKFTVFSNCNHSSNYQLKFKCMSEWCKGNTTKEVNLTSSYFYKEGSGSFNLPDDILEFTEYLPEIFDTQNTLLKNYSIIKTNPGKPKRVQNLSIYCNGGNEVGFKWKPPYPPTGNITHYYLKWNGTCYNKSTILLPSSECGFFENSDICFHIIQRVMDNSTCGDTVLHVQAGIKGHGLGDKASTVLLDVPGTTPSSTSSTSSSLINYSLNSDSTLLGDLKMGLINSSNLSLTWEHSFYDDCTPKQIKIYVNNAPMGNFSLEENIKKIEVSLPRNISKFVLRVTIQKLYDTNETVIAEGNLTCITHLNSEILNDYISIFCKNLNCVIKIPKKFNVDNESGEFFLPWDPTNARQISREKIEEIIRNKKQKDIFVQFRENGEYLEAVVKGPILERNIIEVLHNEYLISPVQGDGSSALPGPDGLSYMSKNLSPNITFIPTTTTRASSALPGPSLSPTKTMRTERAATTELPTTRKLLAMPFYVSLSLIIVLLGALISSFVYRYWPQHRTEGDTDIHENVEIRSEMEELSYYYPNLIEESIGLSIHMVEGEEVNYPDFQPTYRSNDLILFDEISATDSDTSTNSSSSTINNLNNYYSDKLSRNKGDSGQNRNSSHQYQKFIPQLSNIIDVDNLEEYLVEQFEDGLSLLGSEFQRAQNICRSSDDIDGTLTDKSLLKYIKGYLNPRGFIAIQFTEEDKIQDFWKMICRKRVRNVVSITDPLAQKRRTQEFWPENEVIFEQIIVTNNGSRKFVGFEITRYNVTYLKGNSCILFHYQLTSWHDHNTYPDEIIYFMKRVANFSQSKRPTVIICDEDVRVGTVALCDIGLRMAKNEGRVDFLNIILNLGLQNVAFLNNTRQYLFAHFLVYDCLCGDEFSIPLNSDFETKIENTVASAASVKMLMGAVEKNEDLYSRIFNSGNRTKTLSRHKNALTIDNIACSRKFIVIKQPSPSSFTQFWQVVNESNANVIVSLNELSRTNPKHFLFWRANSNLSKSSVTVKVVEESNFGPFVEVRAKVISQGFSKEVLILNLKSWKRATYKPSNILDLISIWNQAYKKTWMETGKGTILLTCFNGYTACGLFTAMSILLEKIDVEKKCDVFTAVKLVRRFHPKFVVDWGQFDFLHRIALEYVKHNNEIT